MSFTSDELLTIAQQIASQLTSPCWDVLPPDDRHYAPRLQRVSHPDCYVTVRESQSARGKITLYGNLETAPGGYGNGLAYREEVASITCNPTRPLDHVVNDIRRRLLPVYLDQYERNHAYIAEQTAYVQRQQETDVRLHDAMRAYDLSVRTVDPHIRVYGKVEAADTVTLELRGVPIAQAEAILTGLLDVPTTDDRLPD